MDMRVALFDFGFAEFRRPFTVDIRKRIQRVSLVCITRKCTDRLGSTVGLQSIFPLSLFYDKEK